MLAQIAAFTACILVVKRNCIAGSSTLSTPSASAETRLADDTKELLRHLEDDDLSLALSHKKRKRNSQELSEKRIRVKILP